MKQTLRLLTTLLALILMFSLVSCSQESPEAPEGFLLAENEGADYYFYYPETWLLDRTDAGMTSAFVSETDFSNVSVTAFTVSGQYTSLEQYAREYYLKQFSDNFNNLEPEYNQDGSLKRNNLKIDDRDAVTFQYKATFAGEEYSFRAWLISDSGYVYTVLYTAKSDVYENHLSYAELIAENIRFK